MGKLKIAILVIFVLLIQLAIQSDAKAINFGLSGSFDNIYHAIQLRLPNQDQTWAAPIVADQAIVETATIIANFTPAKKVLVRRHTVSATAYSSTPDQTDDSPFITAAGTYVRDGIVATNLVNPATGRRYDFGTRIKIPDLYGDKIFVVEDRMNRRYTDRVDIWFPTRAEVLQFGKRTVTIEVIL